jgi:hypothetical protein
MRTLLVLAAAGLAGLGAAVASGCAPGDGGDTSSPGTAIEENAPPEPEAYAISFTTGLTADNDPTDEVTQVSVDAPVVFMYVKWRNLESQRRYELVYTVFDGGGNHVTSERSFMTPSAPRWATWFGHEFKSAGADRRAGTWSFEVTLDGVSRGRKELLVGAAG